MAGTLRAAVHARDRACVRCGSTAGVQVHHRVALVDGGSNQLSNLELLCADCHRLSSSEAHRAHPATAPRKTASRSGQRPERRALSQAARR